LIGFLVDVEFVWGFQARVIGLSKTSPSFLYPPPTTFLGALAESLSKSSGFSESASSILMKNLSSKLLAIGWRPLNCKPIRYEDLNRIISISVKGIKKIAGKAGLHPTLINLAGSFDSPARGKTSLYSFDDRAPTIRWFLVFKEKTINLDKRTIRLEDGFWRIHRIGSKESRVSVVEVESFTPKARSGNARVNHAFPMRLGRPTNIEDATRKWLIESYLNPYNGESFDKPLQSYFSETIRFMSPILENKYDKPPFIRVQPTKEANIYIYEEEVVVGIADRG